MTSSTKRRLIFPLFAAAVLIFGLTKSVSAQPSAKVYHKTVKVGDLDIFYSARMGPCGR